ncbi:beta-1,3-galactosyltransferase 5-like [Argiope bruennichi]|uniref:Hexosyltransferase n=1 Tax=Argiope bruennichi TaxID=94029 RepID=A0A8T0EUB5_ARGBR|nr:beta-1,3-galactosyltransferase 5-like [Argiope bruennichi]KAF8777619.1 Beta-1 like protein [Argiope bruennichi]
MKKIGRLRIKRIIFIIFFLFSSAVILSKVITKDPTKDDPEIFSLPPAEEPVFQLPNTPVIVPPYSQWIAKPCKEPQPTVLAIVHSSPSHLLHRRAIRQTWGSFPPGQNMTIKTVFVVGRSKLPKIQQRLEREAGQHGDIVALEMIDSYTNLTAKHLAGLRWGLKNCPRVAYIMKADDDALIDVRRAIKVLQSGSLGRNMLACRIVPEGTSPRRSGKWMVTRQDYPYQEYPEYCSGLAYFGTMSAMAGMYQAATSGKMPYLWIDDVFLTGFAATQAGVKRLDMSVWFARTDQDIIKWMKNGNGERHFPWIVAEMSPRYWPTDALSLWNRIKQANNGIPELTTEFNSLEQK